MVYLRLPAGGRLKVVPRGGDYSLELPAGSRADRVEFLGDGDIDAEPMPSWRVLDVRGTSFDGEGQRFHVLRPVRTEGGALLGIDWPRGGAVDADVTTALGQLVLRGHLAGPAGAAERERAADKVRQINDCASCHVPLTPPRAKISSPGAVNRGTDASGLFQVASVLRDRLPFETYRPRDANRGDSLVRRLCSDQEVTTSSCGDGSVPQGALDVRRGVRTGDRHVMRVCASRRALAAAIDAPNEAITQALSECTPPGVVTEAQH